MNQGEAPISQDDVDSMTAKLRTFADGLLPAEQTAWRMLLTSLVEQRNANADVQGYGLGITFGIEGIYTYRVEFADLFSGGGSTGSVVRDHRGTPGSYTPSTRPPPPVR